MKNKILKSIIISIASLAMLLNFTIPAYAITQDEMMAITRARGSEGPTTGGAHPELSTYNNNNIKAPTTTPTAPVEIAPKCEHEYTSEITKEPTCTETGVETYTCTKCGKVYTEKTEVAPHEYTSKATVEPMCTEVGEMTYTCNICGNTYTEEIKALGHNESKWKTTKEPTCSEKGSKETRCTHCNEVMNTAEIEALGHESGEWEVETKATMFHKGLLVQRCTRCNEVLATEELPIEMLGWYIVGGISLMASIIAVVLIVVRKKKK